MTLQSSDHLSAHFTVREMACHCCGQLPDNRDAMNELLMALENLRSLSLCLILVNDAYRCPRHNAEVEPNPEIAKHSQHLAGAAADIRMELLPPAAPGDAPAKPILLTTAAIARLALQVPQFKNGGIGVYLDGGGQLADFAHLDVRGTRARWGMRRENGRLIECAITDILPDWEE